jgi:transcriptional regulator with XRE-family HTH domain
VTDNFQQNQRQPATDMVPKKTNRGGPPIAKDYLEALGKRIVDREAELGIKTAEVARRAGVGNTTVYEYERGARENPQLSVLIAISIALEWPLATLLGETDNFVRGSFASPSTTTIPIVGIADAGAYRISPMPETAHDSITADALPPDPRFETFGRFAIRVADRQLEGLSPPVLPGHLALCVDLTGQEVEVETGHIYLLHRSNGVGQIQSTFWQATRYRDRIEFAPVTNSIEYNQREKLTVDRDWAGASDEVTLGGLLYRIRADYL